MPNEPSKEDVQWLADALKSWSRKLASSSWEAVAAEVYKLLNVTGRRERECKRPEPKFKVGQVVRNGVGREDYIWKIASWEYRCGHWCYTDGKGNWLIEDYILPLTPEEANLPPTPSALDKLTPEFFEKHETNMNLSGSMGWTWTCSCGAGDEEYADSHVYCRKAIRAHLCEELWKLLEGRP